MNGSSIDRGKDDIRSRSRTFGRSGKVFSKNPGAKPGSVRGTGESDGRVCVRVKRRGGVDH
ncbi:putative partitioning protein [Methylocaldum marinum]|uniref:Putative partitioning protein n=1 Tax=Methylocaldum marinum TaxID=1432792 RepID=A0A250KW23_9GAMM|nr:putative partitioning protein [Methylocaldum marinum]